MQDAIAFDAYRGRDTHTEAKRKKERRGECCTQPLNPCMLASSAALAQANFRQRAQEDDPEHDKQGDPAIECNPRGVARLEARAGNGPFRPVHFKPVEGTHPDVVCTRPATTIRNTHSHKGDGGSSWTDLRTALLRTPLVLTVLTGRTLPHQTKCR